MNYFVNNQSNLQTYAVPKLPYFFTYTENNHLKNALMHQIASILVQSLVMKMAYAALHRKATSNPIIIAYKFFKNKTTTLTKIFLLFTEQTCFATYISLYSVIPHTYAGEG